MSLLTFPKCHAKYLSELMEDIEMEKENQNGQEGPGVSSQYEKISEAIVNFIVMERLPLSKCDSVHLSRLVHGNFNY